MENKDVKILVVDDEEDITNMSARILKYEGYTTLTAFGGVEALEIFKKEHPQINIIDIYLGHSPINGIELMQKIKAMDRDAKCIIMTRATDPQTVKKVKDAGVEVYMSKPVDTEEWLNTIKEVAETLK